MTAQRNSSTQGGTRDVSHMFKLLSQSGQQYHVVDLKFYTWAQWIFQNGYCIKIILCYTYMTKLRDIE